MRLETVDSTNSYTVSRDNLMLKSGVVVYADNQTKGRGRFDRKWLTVGGGNLFATLVVHPQLPGFLVSLLPVFAGVAVHKTVSDIMGLNCNNERLLLKWPNDILLYGKKLSGILCESRQIQGFMSVAVGIGLNIKGRSYALPLELRKTVSTLESVGVDVERDELLGKMLDIFDEILIEVHGGRYEKFLDYWRNVSWSIGKKVAFDMEGERMCGVIDGLDSKGRLNVLVSESSVVSVSSGEVLYL